VGRAFTSDLRFSDKSMARHHAILEVFPDRQFIRANDKQSSLKVDNQQKQMHGPLREGDEIQLGNVLLRVDQASTLPGDLNRQDAAQQGVSPTDNTVQNQSRLNAMESGSTWRLDTDEIVDGADQHGSVDMQSYAELLPVRQAIQQQIQTQLDLQKRNLISEMTPDELRAEATRMARSVIDNGSVVVPSGVEIDALVQDVVAEAIGLGPIEPLLKDASITEIMINGPSSVYVERSGRLEKSSYRFINDLSLMSAIERIVTPLGRRIDEGAPMVDARLTDGSRVNAIIPPLSLKGPVVTIRKFSKKRFDMDHLVGLGALSPDMAKFLLDAVRLRKNIIVSGGTGSGKTTFLNALSDAIPNNERIVTIEDAAELRLAQQHVVTLEARPANAEGAGHVSIRDLVRNALRMRPDRIVIGECRGGEALDMLQAMNTGHDGSLTTGHANSPRDLLSRLEVMVLMSGMDLPIRAIREQISSAVDIIVQQMRFRDGRRRVTGIVEVDGMEGDVVLTQSLFEFQQTGVLSDGQVIGEYAGLGNAPRFYAELEAGGIAVDRERFARSWSADNDKAEVVSGDERTQSPNPAQETDWHSQNGHESLALS
jgi:pilus assembly protein CpaF